MVLRQRTEIAATRKTAVVSALIGIAILAIQIVFPLWKFHPALCELFIPFLLFATWFFMPSSQLPNWLTSCTFPILLMHVMFFPYVGFALKNLKVDKGLVALEPTLNFIIGFTGPIVVANVLRGLLPKLSRILFGGR